VVQPGREMSAPAAERPINLADAALHQGSAAAQQHPQIHRGPARTAASVRVAAEARNITASVQR